MSYKMVRPLGPFAPPVRAAFSLSVSVRRGGDGVLPGPASLASKLSVSVSTVGEGESASAAREFGEYSGK